MRSEHKTTCPRRRYGDHSYDLSAQLTYCGLLTGFRISAGALYTMYSGRCSLRNRLTYEPVVPDTSPAFTVIQNA
jgi:hypothetical protein